MEADLQAEQRVLDPVRLALPLLPKALGLRLLYLRELAICLAWIPIGVFILVMWVPISMAIEMLRSLPHRLRRIGRRSKIGSRP